MAASTKRPTVLTDKSIKRVGFTGIGFGIVALLLCELPIMLAAVGFGGLASVTGVFQLSHIVEIAAVTSGVLGLFALIAVPMRRTLRNHRRKRP